MNIYFITIAIILIGGFFLHVVVELLNIRNASAEVPKEFQGIYDQEKYSKSQAYLKTNTYFDLVRGSSGLVLLLIFILLGGFNFLDEQARALYQSELITGLIFIGALSLGSWLFSLPFSIYRTFVIEEKFGFNRTTLRTFIIDQIKGLVLGGILGGLALSAVLWFFASFGENAWVLSWVGLTVFQLFLLFVAPVVIFPLFNKFEPLEDGELKASIETYASSQNFKMQGIFKMDGSRRSTKANAYFTGFGRFRRIVLFDTLISRHSVPELVAVLAHEIGHYKEKHIFRQLVVSILSSGFMFWIFSKFLNNRDLFDAFRMDNVSIYGSLIFFGILYSPISKLLGLYRLHLSRKYEFEADAFASKTYGKPQDLIEALKKLSVENLSNLTPHPLKVFFEYTHPPVLKRVRVLQSHKA